MGAHLKSFIVYEELVFPQVEELSRSLPWLLPLGRYTPEELAEVGGKTFGGERFGVLPSLPYGWEDSLLPLPQGLLLRFLDSLLEVLEQDGWERICLVVPREMAFLAAFEQVQHFPTPPPPLRMQPVAVLPIGHTEQHGFHLALNTDTVIVEGLSQRMHGPVTVLPPWPYGVSMHRRQFPGTLSVDPRIFEDLWVAAAESLIARGFECVFLLNGHGGNHSFLVNAVKYCGDRFPQSFVYTTFLHTSFGKALQRLLAERKSCLMGHACELETSYMMALRPDCVHMEWAVDEIDFLSSPQFRMDWVEEGAIIANPPWSDDTLTGSYGAPTLASLERGQTWLAAAAQDLSELAEEVWQQQQERKIRRRGQYREEAWYARWEGLQSQSAAPASR